MPEPKLSILIFSISPSTFPRRVPISPRLPTGLAPLRYSWTSQPNRRLAGSPLMWRSVMDVLRGPAPDGSPVWYQKHMWHHMAGPVGHEDFEGFTHAFLIREPERMIASYLRKREVAAFEDFGLERQAEFFEREADRLGHAPPVIGANDVLVAPGTVLAKLCAALGIEWDPRMLAWEPGPRMTDGPWAPHWYGAVEASSGFGPPETEPVELAGEAHFDVADRGLVQLQPLLVGSGQPRGSGGPPAKSGLPWVRVATCSARSPRNPSSPCTSARWSVGASGPMSSTSLSVGLSCGLA